MFTSPNTDPGALSESDFPQEQTAPAENDTTSAPVSLADVQRLLGEHTEQVQRLIQSQVDKAESRVSKRFAELQSGNARALEVARSAGMTDDQLEAYRRKLHDDAMTRAIAEGGQGQEKELPPAQPGQAPQPFDANALAAQAQRIAEQGKLSPDDPEVGMILTAADGASPEEYLASIRVAVLAKQKRLSQPSAPRPAQAPTFGPQGGRTTEDLSRLSSQELAERAAAQILSNSRR